MKSKELIIDFEVDINKSSYRSVTLEKGACEIEYADNMSPNKVILFSANTKHGYITDEPIRNLYFQEDVSELKIIIFNKFEGNLKGQIKLKYTHDKEPEPIVSEFTNSNFDISDIMAFGEMVNKDEQQNNYFINKFSPVQVKYFRVEPDRNSADYMLNEYGIKELVDEKCISIITKDNSLPQDEEATYTEWGYQFTSFVASVSKVYFEEMFGKGMKPRKDDFLIFMIGGMMMTVGSVQQVFGANRCLLGWNLSLVHHAINGSVQGTENLDLYAENSEKIFREMGANDGRNATNQEQNLSKLVHHDYSRSMLSQVANIIESDLWNYYSITNNPEENAIVSYKHAIDLSSELSISFYYRGHSEDAEDVLFMIEDVLEIGVASDTPYLIFFGKTYQFPDADFTDWNKWQIAVININISENKIDLIRYDYTSKQRISKKHVIESPNVAKKGFLNVVAGDSDLAQIRVWRKVLPIEFEERLTYNKVVEKPSSTYVIDNCDVILNSRTHVRPDNMERWKDFEENRRPVN